MTSKIEGYISLEGEEAKVILPAGTKIPDKKDWHNYAIWEFNGKRYRPVTQKAVDNLENTVKALEAYGFKGASKPGKRKLSSLKYAVCTTGIEDFTFVK